MLSPLNPPEEFAVRILLPKKSCNVGMAGRKQSVERDDYGRFTRSNEYSPGVAVSGCEPGHALQVRQRAEDSGIQAGQPVAVQKIKTGPVDGRAVQRDGSEAGEESEGGYTSCHVKAGTYVWIWVEVNRWAGRRLFEHQG